ncbi:BnaA05g32180D [Brassica napus]|uniref:BnaA05g32180D protein n=1 Tax=Brassica napus TaxID=3708 RepID=A0A078GRH0_BRANA|nr:BnaA05g32180D [Brassica napus]
MDCNKEEATRAMNVAEEKMRCGDFVGAQKLVMKAQRLFPELENVQKLLAVCDVHSSADKKIKGLDDWYGILQVQPSADSDTIKKQYRKLCLLLHPDKNKFPGAEAAFKFVGEANRWLSDQIKRSQYDVRYRSHSLFASRESNANSLRSASSSVNTAAVNIASGLTFWTCCRNCGHRYKYLKVYVNQVMRCSSCQKSYTACNIGSDEVPFGSSTADANQEMNNTSRQHPCTGAESGSSSAAKAKNETVGKKINKRIKEPETSAAAEMNKNGTVGGKLNKRNQKRVAGDKKPEKDEGCIENDAEAGRPQIGAEIPKPDILKPQPEEKEPQNSAGKSMPDLSAPKTKQTARKKRKSVEESSMSFEVDGSDAAVDKTDTDESNKRKPQVSYAEKRRNSDSVIPPTKKTKSGCEVDESDVNTKQTDEDNTSLEPAEKGKAKESENSGNNNIFSGKNKESEGFENGHNKADENRNTLEIPDPEFNVFEDERRPENFAVNQVWSTCDSRDGMPRRYARVRKVLSSDFKLRVTYLKPVQENNDESIPVTWGKFNNGETKDVENRSIFSGQMLHSVCNRVVSIYPRKGEIWAMFSDWDEESSTLENHELPYKYDVVEIVNDFKEEAGIGAAYLGKVKGFVSLFQREAKNTVCQVQLAPERMLRFSHKVPAVKMTGTEKEGVPAGSYELDPTALPKDIFQVEESAKQGDKMKTPKTTDKGLVTDSLGINESSKGIQQRVESQVGEGSKKRGRDGELPSSSKQNDLPAQLDGSTNKLLETTPASSSCKTPQRNAFDFNNERSVDKFRRDQTWAIYSDDKGMPTEYVKIKKVETKPELVLHVAHMELCPPSTEPVTRSVSCGEFKMETGKPKTLPLTRFSHRVKPFDSKQKIVKVYPRKGDIWALRKNCDSTEEEHDIVEVVEGYCEGKSIKAMALTAKGFSSIYTRKHGSHVSSLVIPKAEMSRFSHQVPAVKQEKRATRLAEGGYWELDPAAIPPPTTIVID